MLGVWLVMYYLLKELKKKKKPPMNKNAQNMNKVYLIFHILYSNGLLCAVLKVEQHQPLIEVAETTAEEHQRETGVCQDEDV